MGKNKPESHRAAQAAYRRRQEEKGAKNLLIPLTPEQQAWLDNVRAGRSRTRAICDLLEIYRRQRWPIPKIDD